MSRIIVKNLPKGVRTSFVVSLYLNDNWLIFHQLSFNFVGGGGCPWLDSTMASRTILTGAGPYFSFEWFTSVNEIIIMTIIINVYEIIIMS